MWIILSDKVEIPMNEAKNVMEENVVWGRKAESKDRASFTVLSYVTLIAGICFW